MPTLCNMRANLTRFAIEIDNTQHNSGALGPHASRNPTDPHQLPSYPQVRETHGSVSQSYLASVGAAEADC
eukprot:1156826-Pelagomonas_calceolata.AAC.3